MADEDDRRQLAEYVRGLGATPEEIEAVVQTRNVGGLVLDLVLRADREVLSFGEAVTRAGLSFDDAARYWRARAFPTPRPTRRGFRPKRSRPWS